MSLSLTSVPQAKPTEINADLFEKNKEVVANGGLAGMRGKVPKGRALPRRPTWPRTPFASQAFI